MATQVQTPELLYQGAAVPLRRERTGVSPLVIALCVLAAVAILAAGPDVFRSQRPAAVIWVTAGALLALAVYGFRVAARSKDNPWFAPLYFATAFYFFKYGWGCLVAYYWGSFPWEVFPELHSYFYRYGVWYNLPSACRLFLLGGLGLFLGLSISGGPLVRALSRFNWQVSEEQLKFSIFVLTPAILVLFWFLSSRTQGALPYSVIAFASITDGLTVLSSYYAFSASGLSKRLKWLAFLGVIFLLKLPTSLLSGQMVPILTPFLMILFGYVLARRRPPWIWLAIGIPVALFIVLPFTALYKFSESGGGITDRIEMARERFAVTSYPARLELSLARTVARLCGAQFPTVFMQYYPGVYPFARAKSFSTEASGLVPRALWRDKPEISPELNRYSERVGLVRAESGTSAVFDALSEYYVNFGAAGVLLLFVFHGWYLGVLYEWLVRRLHYLVGSAVYLCLIPGNWDFFGIVNQLTVHLKLVPAWLLLLYFMSRKSR